MAPRKKVSPGQERRARGEQPVYDSYGRLSRVPETGELEKIDDQLADNQTVIGRLGGTVGEELSDGLSAWKKGVRRPGWERLLERAESGDSDGIVVWHTDRLFRQPRDLEALIELGDRGFLVASAHGARDLADPDDRFILRIEVAHAARSSDDTSRRIKRRFETLRASGQRTGGARAFGLPGYVVLSQADREALEVAGVERPVVSVEQVAAERRAVAEGMSAVLAGVSFGQLARDWNAAGLLTPRGNRWQFDTLRDVLARPLNAGLIEHEGVIVGRMEGEPMADEETFTQVRALIAGRRRGRTPGKRYVGSGIVRCGECGRGVSGRLQQPSKAYSRERRVYFCAPHRGGCGKVTATVPAVDRELRGLVVQRLSDPEHAAQVTAFTSKRTERLTQVRAEIEQTEQLQEAMAARVGRVEMTLTAFDAANQPLAARLAGLRQERDSLESGDLGPLTVATRDEIEAEWDTLGEVGDVAGQRAMLRRALGRHHLILDRATSRAPRFDPTRLRLAAPQPAEPQSTEQPG
ncbi:MAG TPA: recombinase family protein [Pseudonocardiaceae bacterium]|jgi:DNA invertase Pin-like site-specific DNA recombinase|nr:recombinase family protein [Pseudonocardiaceae bacterium]